VPNTPRLVTELATNTLEFTSCTVPNVHGDKKSCASAQPTKTARDSMKVSKLSEKKKLFFSLPVT
jgi:hypothetical protein